MALRIGPPPALARLRLHWNATCNHWTRQARVWRDYRDRSTAGVYAWWRQTSERSLRTVPVVRLRRNSQARQQAQIAAFMADYEELVDVLCWAAQVGADADSTEKYARLRGAMLVQYPRLRARFRPYLQGMDGGQQPLDPFQSLFVPERLDDVIHADDAIEHMMVTQNALDAYRRSLNLPVA